jgi:hypothetical protein
MGKRRDGRSRRSIGAAAVALGIGLGAAASGIMGSGCGDGGGPDTRVYAFGRVTEGSACPAGTSEAYRDGDLIVCNSCETNAECPSRVCVTQCGPGCENDPEGCCAVRDCLPIPCCPVCGDGVCDGDERACNCPLDGCAQNLCIAKLPTCGDGRCESGASPGESHERCAADCPLDCQPCAAAP